MSMALKPSKDTKKADGNNNEYQADVWVFPHIHCQSALYRFRYPEDGNPVAVSIEAKAPAGVVDPLDMIEDGVPFSEPRKEFLEAHSVISRVWAAVDGENRWCKWN